MRTRVSVLLALALLASAGACAVDIADFTTTADGGGPPKGGDATAHHDGSGSGSGSHASDGAADSPAKESGSHLDTGHDTGHDAGHEAATSHDTGVDGGMDASAPPWAGLSLVQFAGSAPNSQTSTTTVSFTKATTAGNLLIALESPPIGGGWHQIVAGNTYFYVWPNNPGGITTMTFEGSNFDAGSTYYFYNMEMEFSGAPSTVGVDFSVIASSGASATTLTIDTDAGAPEGVLELIYLGTGSATSASASTGWNLAGADHGGDFAWWRASTATAPTATLTYAPQEYSSGSIFVLDGT